MPTFDDLIQYCWVLEHDPIAVARRMEGVQLQSLIKEMEETGRYGFPEQVIFNPNSSEFPAAELKMLSIEQRLLAVLESDDSAFATCVKDELRTSIKTKREFLESQGITVK